MGQQYSFTKLPNHAQVLALRMFDDIELVAFSFLSNRTLTVAKSLKRKTDVRVAIKSDVKVTLETDFSTRLTFYENRNPPPTEFHVPNTINIQIRTMDRVEDLVWENMTVELKAWILHIMKLFHQSSLSQIYITSEHRFSLNSIYHLLSDLKADSLDFFYDTTTTRSIQAPSLLIPSHLLIFRNRNPFETPTELQKMLLQNVTSISANDFQSFQLNDLMTCNCKILIADHVQISVKQMRKWFKLWENGANPRLETVFLNFYTTDPEIDSFVDNQAQYTKLTREVYMGYAYPGADVRNRFELWRKDRRGMAHVVVTREIEMDRVLCTIWMKVFN